MGFYHPFGLGGLLLRAGALIHRWAGRVGYRMDRSRRRRLLAMAHPERDRPRRDVLDREARTTG